MNSIKNRIENINNKIDDYPRSNYYPIVRFTNMGLESNLILSFVLGWNINNKSCYISKEKLSNMFELSLEKVDSIINNLINEGLIEGEYITFKGGKTKVFNVNIDKLEQKIEANSQFIKKSKIIEMKRQIAELEN